MDVVKLPELTRINGHLLAAATSTLTVNQVDGTPGPATIYGDEAAAITLSSSGAATWVQGVPAGWVAAGHTYDILDGATVVYRFEAVKATATTSGLGPRIDALEADTVRASTAVNPVNTASLFLSQSSQDPSLTAGFHGLFNSGSESRLSTMDDYAVDGAGAGGGTSIYQLSSAIYNSGTKPAVAVAGFARGGLVWGSNLVVMADGAGSSAAGIEVDFGIVTKDTGQAIGLALHAHNNSGNPAMYLQMLARGGLANPGPMTGIQIAVNGNLALITSGAQTPDTAGTLLLTSAAGASTSGMFTYGGNVYDYTGVSGTSLTGVTLFYGTAGLSIPSGATVNLGTQPVYQPGYLFKVSGGVSVDRGIDLSPGIFKAYALQIPMNSTVGGIGLNFKAQGGGVASGSAIQFTAVDAASSVTFGIRFNGTGGVQGVAPGGTLIYVDGGTYGKALDLAAGTFAASGAIAMGNNNISAGTTTGMKIGTATSQKLGFFNATPVVQPTIAAAATDAATTQTLANSLRTAIRALGLAV